MRLAAALAVGGAASAFGADKFFDFSTSGATWDNGLTSNFSLATGGPYTSPWAAYDVAIFEGTGGAVTLSGAPNVNRLVFNADGYILSGSTLNMGNPGGLDNFTVNSTHTATINSNISQTFGTAIQKAGTGTLVLTGTVTSTASNNRVEGGTLRLGGGVFTGSAWIADSTGTSGTLDVTAGSHAISTLVVATRGNGTFTIGGGTVTVPSVSLGHSVADVSSGTVNLNGGTLVVGSGGITSPGASDTTVFNFNGGTLRASANAASFMPNTLDRANVRDGGAVIDTQGFSVTIAQPLLHSNIGGDAATDGGLTKAGSGTLTLTGANTYTGPTTIPASSGTVIGTVNSTQNSFGTGSASVGTGSVLRYENTETANAATTTIGNVLTGTGTVQLNFAAGTNARNTRMDNVTGFNGTIQLSASGATGDKWNLGGARNAPNATVEIGSGAQMYANGGTSTFALIRLAGTGNGENRGAIRLQSSVTAPLALTGNATLGGEGGAINGTVTTAVGGTSTLTIGTTNSNNLPVNMMNGDISNGVGTLALNVFNQNGGNIFIAGSRANTYSGGTTLLHSSSGTRLVIGSITATPYGSGPITIGLTAADRAGIYFTTAGQTLANAIVFNTALGTDRAGIRADVTNITLSGQVTANLADATFSTNGTGSFNLTNQVTGNQGLRLHNAFGSTITVNLNNAAQNNNYNGDTTIEGTKGILTLGAPNQIPNGAGKGNLVNNGALRLGGNSETVNGLSGSGSVDGQSGTPTLTIGDNNATSTHTGAIQNSGGTLSIAKIGTGTLTLSGGSYSGPTTISAGTLRAGSNSALGNTTGATTISGGTFDINGFSLGAEQVNLAGGVITNTGGDQISALQRVTVSADSTVRGTGRWDIRNGGFGLTVNPGVTLTKADNNFVGVVNNPIVNNGLISVDAGVLGLHLNVASTGTGTYVVKPGAELEISSHGTPVTVANGVTSQGGKLSSRESSGGVSSFNGPLTLSGGGDTTFEAAASFNVTGAIGGSGNLVKTGTGTLTVSSGANTHAGRTEVRAGTLNLTGGGGGLGAPSAVANAITLGSAGSSGTLALSGGGLTLPAGAGITLAGNGGTLNVGAGLTVAMNAGISGNVVGSTFTKAGDGTFNLTGGSQINALVVSGGVYEQLAGVTEIISTTTGLSISNGATYRLSGGTLRTDRITTAGTGAFVWGSGTLMARSSNGNLGVTDHSAPTYQAVLTGLTTPVTADLATSAGSVWAMHGSPSLYLNNGVRFNNWAVDGDLDLTAAGDTLEFDLNPYLLRPFSSGGISAIETGSLPLVTWTGAFAAGGDFSSVTGVNTTQGGGFNLSAFSVTDPTALDPNTWWIEYDEAASTIWFHYKVTGYVPEPASFGLLAAGALGLRLLRTLRVQRRRVTDIPA